MDWKKVTGIFIGIMFLIIVGYDVYAIIDGGTEASISHWIIVASYKYPFFTFMAGILCGHLFWRVRGTKDLRKIEDATREEDYEDL